MGSIQRSTHTAEIWPKMAEGNSLHSYICDEASEESDSEDFLEGRSINKTESEPPLPPPSPAPTH